MTDVPPEPPQEETWDEMAARVAAEEINQRYASQLWSSMSSYRAVGFTDEQAWALVLAEHSSRLDYIGRAAMMSQFTAVEDPDDPEAQQG